ncbi:hypothetical protein [Roseicyclus amphidinii]|uniref:hypothetical protein n=1 Tax=Roseicyclus amphidinii TaxID=3034232 RepID=UPI0024E18FBA|nr:hypothetical protein [Roseicyclus sp. Amp-Y-6]
MATEPEDARLEALFAAAREAERPGDDLVARVLADAAMVQAAARPSSGRRWPVSWPCW